MNGTSTPPRRKRTTAASADLAARRALIVTVTACATLLMATVLALAGPVQDGQNGSTCERHAQCLSYYCADGRKCAPQDFTGRRGDYCHHNNHCASRQCICESGGFGFCKEWERWVAGTYSTDHVKYSWIGRCL